MAKRLSQPNGYLSNVWDIAGDTYDHNDIKGWLDTIDRLMGQLYSDTFPVGSVIGISGPSLSSTPDTNPIIVPSGWALCDGRTITAANHDFPAPYAGNTIYVPDYRGRALVGADSAIGIRVAGTTSTNPGVKGRQGATTSAAPDHFHIHDHTHGFGGNHLIETSTASAGDAVSTDAAGSGYLLTRQPHTHGVKRQNTSRPEASTNPDDLASLGEGSTQLQTTAQILKTGGTLTVPTGGSAGDDLVVDVRQPSEAVYHIMKVKKYAGSATP